MCRCPHHTRRQAIGLFAGLPLLAACKPQIEGPEEIRWGRETCEICGMIISDPFFAAEIRGGADRKLYKFDDIGDAVHWLKMQDWAEAANVAPDQNPDQNPDIEFWVRDVETGTRWLDARGARYLTGLVSPMDYGFGAVESSGPDTISYPEMFQAALDMGLSSRCLPQVLENYEG